MNFLVNDVTFLLGDGLSALKSIHETQVLLNEGPRWRALSHVYRHLFDIVTYSPGRFE